MLEHPLFEAFIQLKWLKLSKIHLGTLLFFLLHLLAITLFALAHFGSFQMDALSKEVVAYILLTTNILLLVLQLTKVYSVLRLHNNIPGFSIHRDNLYPLLDLITPILGFLVVTIGSREVTSLLVLFSSWQFMRMLTIFPRVGKNIFITFQVTQTILELLLSYVVALFAFTITFHILLTEPPFDNLGDTFIKIVMMLLGEVEFGHLKDISWLTKLIFLAFVILMSIVLINLVIGLSISDVVALRLVVDAMGSSDIYSIYSVQEGCTYPQGGQHGFRHKECEHPEGEFEQDLQKRKPTLQKKK